MSGWPWKNFFSSGAGNTPQPLTDDQKTHLRRGLYRLARALSPTAGHKNDDECTFSIETDATRATLETLFTDDFLTKLGEKINTTQSSIENKDTNDSSNADDTASRHVDFELRNAFTSFKTRENLKREIQGEIRKAAQASALASAEKKTTNAAQVSAPPPSVGSAYHLGLQGSCPQTLHMESPIGELPARGHITLQKTAGSASWLFLRYSNVMSAWYEAPLDESIFRSHVASQERAWHARKMLTPLAKGRCRIHLTWQTGPLRVHVTSTDEERAPYAFSAVLYNNGEPLVEILNCLVNDLNVWDRHKIKVKLLDAIGKRRSIECTLDHIDITTDHVDLKQLQTKWPYDVLHVNQLDARDIVVELSIDALNAERGFEYYIARSRSEGAPFSIKDAVRTTGDHAPLYTVPTPIPEALTVVLVTLVEHLTSLRVHCALQTEYHRFDALEEVDDALQAHMDHPLTSGIRVLLRGIQLLNSFKNMFEPIEILARATMLVLGADLSFKPHNETASLLARTFRSMLYGDELRQDFRMSCIDNTLFEATTWLDVNKSDAETAIMELCVCHGDAMRDGMRLFVHDDLALQWRLFQVCRLDWASSLTMRNVPGLKALAAWTGIECELVLDELFELCKEARDPFEVFIAWLTAIAWQLHRDAPISNPQDDLFERVDLAERELRDALRFMSTPSLSATHVSRACGTLSVASTHPVAELNGLVDRIVRLVCKALEETDEALSQELKRTRLPPCTSLAGFWYSDACTMILNQVTTPTHSTSNDADLNQMASDILHRIGVSLTNGRTHDDLVRLLAQDSSMLTQIAAPRAAVLIMYCKDRVSARIRHCDNLLNEALGTRTNVERGDLHTVMARDLSQRIVKAALVLSTDVLGTLVSPEDGGAALDVLCLDTSLTWTDAQLVEIADLTQSHQFIIPKTFCVIRHVDVNYFVVKRCDLDELCVDLVDVSKGMHALIESSSPLLQDEAPETPGVYEIVQLEPIEVARMSATEQAASMPFPTNDDELVARGLWARHSADLETDYKAYLDALYRLEADRIANQHSIDLLWWLTMHATKQLPPPAYVDNNWPTPLGTIDQPRYFPRDGTLARWYDRDSSSTAHPDPPRYAPRYAPGHAPDQKPTVLHTGGVALTTIDSSFQTELCLAAEAFLNGAADAPQRCRTLLKRALLNERVFLPAVKRMLATRGHDPSTVGSFFRLFDPSERPSSHHNPHHRTHRQLYSQYSTATNCVARIQDLKCPHAGLLYEFYKCMRDTPPANEHLFSRRLRNVVYGPTTALASVTTPLILTTNGNRFVLFEHFRVHALAMLAWIEQTFGGARAVSLDVEAFSRIGVCAPLFIDQPNRFGALLTSLGLPPFATNPNATSSMLLSLDHDFLEPSTLDLFTNMRHFSAALEHPLDATSMMDDPADTPSFDDASPNETEGAPGTRSTIPIEGNWSRNSPVTPVPSVRTVDEPPSRALVNYDDLLNTYDGFLSLVAPQIDTYTYDRAIVCNDLRPTNVNADDFYKTWYLNIHTSITDTRLQPIGITSNDDAAKLHEQAVLFTAAWLMKIANPNHENKDMQTLYDAIPVVKKNDGNDMGKRPVFPKQFRPNIQGAWPPQVVGRVAITVPSMIKLVSNAYKLRDEASKTIRSLTCVQSELDRKYTQAASRRLGNVNPKRPLKVVAFNATMTPNDWLSAYVTSMETIYTLRNQCTSDAAPIKYTHGDQAQTAVQILQGCIENTDLLPTNSIQGVEGSVNRYLYVNTTSRPGDQPLPTWPNVDKEYRLSTEYPPSKVECHCRYVDGVANSQPDPFAERSFKTEWQPANSWSIAQPNMQRVATKALDVDISSDREVTNWQSARHPNVYLDKNRFLVCGNHLGEAWMDSNQTTTVGLRNLAQAVRKHMTYARLVACHTKKNTKDDANGSNTTQYDDANDRDIMKDLENRLKVSEKTGAFVTDPLLPRSKAGLSNMHQTLLYQLLDNFICMICYEGSRFCGLDLHLHEWTTLVHTFVLCVLSRYVPGLDRRGAMVFASLQYLPLVWSFIDRNIVLTTQKNILKFLKLIMIGTIAYYNMERGHQKDEIQQITYDFQAVSNIVGYIGGLFLEQDKVRMIQAGIGAISIATRRYEKKIEYEDRTVNRDLTHDIVTRLLQLGPYVIQALHINQVHGQPFFQVLIDGVLVGMMFDRNESVPYLTGDTSTADDALKAMATQEKTVSKLLPQIDIAMNGAFLVAVSNWWMSAPSPATPELDKFAISNGLKELNDDMKAILQDNQAVVFHSTDDDDAKRRLFSKLCNLGMCMQDSTVTVYNQNATLPAIKIQHDAQGFHAAVYSQEWQALVSASTELSLHSLTLDAAVKNAWKHLFRLVDNGPTRASIDAESTDATWPMVGLMLRALASHQYIFNQLVGVLIEPLVAHYLTCGLIILTKTWRPVASFVNDPTNPNAVKSAFTSVADDLDNFLKTGSNALVATFLAPRLRQLFDWERATSPARTDLLYEATLAGWYTTAELKLRGNRRTQKKTPGLIDAPTNGVSQFMGDTRDDRLVKADLDVVDEYTRVTGFRLRYKVDASKRLKETNDLDAYEKTLVRRLELDESLLRDFKRAVVMARDGPCAYRSRLDDEGKTDPIGRASHLGTALTTFAPPDQIRQIGSISAHVQSSESSTTVEITDALNSAITNLLAVRGNAVEEYGHAKRLTQDSAFNHIHPLKNNRIVSLYYQRQLQLMCDHYEGGAWLNTIKFALLMRNLRPLCKDSPPNAETIQTLRAYVDAAYKMSLTRQAYDLLGRICIYNATEAPPKSVSYTPFEWVPALSSNVANTVIQSFLRNDNNSNDIIQAYLRASPHSEPNVDNGHAVWRTYLLLKDDYLLGTFAYPSSLLECTL